MDDTNAQWIRSGNKTELRIAGDLEQIYEAEIVTYDEVIVIIGTFADIRSFIARTSSFVRIRSIRKLPKN